MLVMGGLREEDGEEDGEKEVEEVDVGSVV